MDAYLLQTAQLRATALREEAARDRLVRLATRCRPSAWRRATAAVLSAVHGVPVPAVSPRCA